MTDKEIERIVRLLRGQQWRVDETARHYKCWPPDRNKPMVTIAKTPSDHRALLNIRARLRRSGAEL